MTGYDANLLGTAGSVAFGLSGLDFYKDLSDIAHGLENWENTPGDYLNLGVNLIALLPVIGAFKNLGKPATDAASNVAKQIDDEVANLRAIGANNRSAPDFHNNISQRQPGGYLRAPKSGLTGATRLSPDELATGQRLEQLLGKSLKESPHVGAEYVDDLGRAYDALGTPAASQYWNAKKFFKSIDGHLLKSNDFTVIDLTGFTPTQIAEVKNYLSGLSKAQLDKIIRIGF